MSATTTDSRAQQKEHGFRHGRSGLVVALVLACISSYLLVGILTMTVPQGAASPGPKFFPTLIVVAGYVLSALLAWDTIRRPAPPEPPRPIPEEAPAGVLPAEPSAEGPRMYSDWAALGVAFGGFLAFALLIEPLGWILSAALLFFSVAYAVGSRRFVFDLSLALVLSSLIQLAFGAGLGLNLPAGILGGLF